MGSARSDSGANANPSAKTITAAIFLCAQSCIPFLSVIWSMIRLIVRSRAPGLRKSASNSNRSRNRRRHFPRRIEKWKLARRRPYLVTYGLHREFHLQFRPRRRMLALDARERDHLLERRRPRRRGRFPHL